MKQVVLSSIPAHLIYINLFKMNLDIAINRLHRIKCLAATRHRMNRGYRLDIWKWHSIFQVIVILGWNGLTWLIEIDALSRLVVFFGDINAFCRVPMRLAYSGALWR